MKGLKINYGKHEIIILISCVILLMITIPANILGVNLSLNGQLTDIS